MNLFTNYQQKQKKGHTGITRPNKSGFTEFDEFNSNNMLSY